MRIVFIGTVAASAAWLEETLLAGGDVVGVVTLPPERAAAHGDFADVGSIAARWAVPVRLIANVNDPETIEFLRGLRPDIIFVFGWSQLLGPSLLDLAPAIGSHPALLPRDRGRHPITWALVDGLETSGLTFLWLDEGADTGAILWQQTFAIGTDDDAADVYDTVVQLGRQAIREFLPQLVTGNAPRVAQDSTKATYRPRRTDSDRWIDWSWPTARIHNLVRGLARPYVGALTRWAGQDVLVWRSHSFPDQPAGRAPGTVLRTEPAIVVATGDGAIELLEIEPAVPLRAGGRFGAS